MNAQQRFGLVIGLGLVVAGVVFRKRLAPLAASIAQGVQQSLKTAGGGIVNVASRVWDNIPASAQPFLPLLQKTESSFGIPPTLLTRMAWIESRFNPTAYNAKSTATGILQIIPSIHPVNAADPNAAIPYAGKYLRALYDQFGTWEKAIAAYNWGPGNVQKDIATNGDSWRLHLPAETSSYLAQVEAAIDLPA